MLDPDSELHRRAITSGRDRLPTPTSRQADLQNWRDAFSSIETPTSRDMELFQAALWYAAESQHVRQHFDDSTLAGLGARTATLLAVAELNRTFGVLSRKLQKVTRDAAGSEVVSLDQLAAQRVSNASKIQDFSVGDFGDSSVDATEWWLRRAAALEQDSTNRVDLASTARMAATRFSLERGISFLWQRTLWEGWRLRSDGEVLVHEPRNRDMEALRHAWYFRHMSLFSQPALLGQHDWRHNMSNAQRRDAALSRVVVRIVDNPGRRRHYEVGRPAIRPNEPDSFFLSTLSLTRSYIGDFLDTNLPAVGVSLRQLLQTWHVLNGLAKRLSESVGRNPYADSASVESCALVVRSNDLVDIVRRCLNLDTLRAETLVAFLTWKIDTYKGLWGAPLVPIPSTEKLAIAHLPLSNSNMLRWAEIMMTKGGISDNLATKSKGQPFESAARNRLRMAIGGNKVLVDSLCAEHALKRKGDGEEIDLLLKLGKLLLVGEVKCWLFPAEPVEYYNYRRKLEGAASQALRKAEWVRQNIMIVADHLGIAVDQLDSKSVLPIVVQNQGFGTSLVFENCIVADLDFLDLFLSSTSYISGGALARDGREAFQRTTLYATQNEASTKFEEIMRKPPVLERFRSRLAWRRTEFPTYDGTRLYLEDTDLGDITEDEKSLARDLYAETGKTVGGE